MKPHKHAELIKAWADGAEIEVLNTAGWGVQANPSWDEFMAYRIKPEPKPDVVQVCHIGKNAFGFCVYPGKPNIKLIWDGETGELKSTEVLK